jgi:hypothetical protein
MYVFTEIVLFCQAQKYNIACPPFIWPVNMKRLILLPWGFAASLVCGLASHDNAGASRSHEDDNLQREQCHQFQNFRDKVLNFFFRKLSLVLKLSEYLKLTSCSSYNGRFRVRLPIQHAPLAREKQKKCLVTNHGVVFDFSPRCIFQIKRGFEL